MKVIRQEKVCYKGMDYSRARAEVEEEISVVKTKKKAL